MEERAPQSCLNYADVVQKALDDPKGLSSTFAGAEAALVQQLAYDPSTAPDSLSAARKNEHITGTLSSERIAVARFITTPFIAAAHLSRQERQEGMVYNPDDIDELLPLACYEIPALKEHPGPYARFLTEHTDCVSEGGQAAESYIMSDPNHVHYASPPFLRRIERRKVDAHNCLITLEREAGQPHRGLKGMLLEYPQFALVAERRSLNENAYLIMQPLMAADYACAAKGITDPDEVLHIILQNAPLFVSIIDTPFALFPYCIPRIDSEQLDERDTAGTFKRIAKLCTEGVGHMELRGATLVLPDWSLNSTGKCPLARSSSVKAPQESLGAMDAYYQEAGRRYDIPLALLRANAQLGLAISFFFQYSAMLARDTFLGQSADFANYALSPEATAHALGVLATFRSDGM